MVSEGDRLDFENAKVANLHKHLKTITLVLFTTAILWRLWRGLNWTDVRLSLSQASATLIGAATMVSCATNWLRSLRWRALLAPISRSSLHDVFAATNIGIGSTFLFGTAIGELIRPLALTILNPQVRRATSFLTIVLERVCDVCVLLVLFGLSLLWLPIYGSRAAAITHASEIGVLLIIAPVFLLAALVLMNGRYRSAPNWITERTADWNLIANPVKRFVLRLTHQLSRALALLASTRVLFVVSIWTVFQWLSVILANWLILRAFGMTVGIKGTILVMSCGLIGSFVPTPGGAAGAFHAAISSGLIFIGATLDQAAAISIVAHLVGFAPALIFGSYYFLRSDVKVAQLQQEMSAAGS